MPFSARELGETFKEMERMDAEPKLATQWSSAYWDYQLDAQSATEERRRQEQEMEREIEAYLEWKREMEPR